MKKPIEIRKDVIRSLLKDQINKQKAADLLDCSTRTIERYRNQFLAAGRDGLIDHRGGNNAKLTDAQKDQIMDLKRKDRWRSARNIRDRLELPVRSATVGNVIRGSGLSKQNIKRVKPIIRFEADDPNDLWQTDIMGKITFPNLGDCYLIATLDDHSRFVCSGRWFRKQSKINVFQIWYEALARWGLPKRMLQDEGSQYKARTRFGNADYQWYARQLGIKLHWAKRAQTKGKIERFWRFVQDDFVHEVWNTKTIDELNGKFRGWLARYNWQFKSRYFGGVTRASRYKPSKRKASRVELRTLLVIEERRKVTRESTISLYGKQYYVPPGYIGCRIWVKIVGNKVHFDADGKIFWKTKLKIG